MGIEFLLAQAKSFGAGHEGGYQPLPAIIVAVGLADKKLAVDAHIYAKIISHLVCVLPLLRRVVSGGGIL